MIYFLVCLFSVFLGIFLTLGVIELQSWHRRKAEQHRKFVDASMPIEAHPEYERGYVWALDELQRGNSVSFNVYQQTPRDKGISDAVKEFNRVHSPKTDS